MQRKLIVWCALALIGGVIAFTVGGWRYVRIDPLDLRYHVLTGRIEIHDVASRLWRPSFADDPSAAAVPKSDLQEVTLDRLQWGIGGLLVGRATTHRAINGRVSVNIVILEPNGTRVRERSLRATVRWPEAKENWFVLDTGLGVPDPRMRTVVALEAIQ